MKISEETRIKLDEIKEQYNKSAYEIILKEARENNPYKQGDILADHYQIGKVLNSVIEIRVYSTAYQISYKCERLNKKLRPYRGGEITTIYLQNVESKIK